MASTVAIPHLFNIPGTIPGTIPGPVPGSLPPAIPITTNYTGTALPTATVPTTVPHHAIPTVQLPVVPVGGGCYNDGMEVVWHGEFSRLFSSFYPPHVWYLTITNTAPPLKWKFHRDSAKVRFCCQDCGNGWTSMKGRVTFWFHLDYATNNGYVQFKLYGQQCKKCNSGKFEYVMWYPEEVSKVMCNVYNKVGQTYYGFLQPPIRIDRRPGRPRNQHNSELCQACRDGECDQARPVKSMYNISGLVHAPLAIPAPPVQQEVAEAVASTSDTTPAPQTTTVTVVKPVSVTPSSDTDVSSTVVPPASFGPQQGMITTPITLTGSLQPILTYSIMSAPKATSLPVNSNHFIPQTPSSAVPNTQYYYHPNPMTLISGTVPSLPPPPPPIPMVPVKPPSKDNSPLSNVINTEVTHDIAKVDLKADEKQEAKVSPGKEEETKEAKENSGKTSEIGTKE